MENFFHEFKKFRLIYLWYLITLQLWLVMLLSPKSTCGVIDNVCMVLPDKVLLYSFLYIIGQYKTFFSQTDFRLIYLWSSVALAKSKYG